MLNKEYKLEVSRAKKNYYKNMIKDLKESDPGRWYSNLKRLCSDDQNKSNHFGVESIKHLSPEEQSEIIADKFSKVSQEYEPLKQ